MSDTIQSFDPLVDTTTQILLWQYNNAPKITNLLIQKQQWYVDNISGFWHDWIRDVFTLSTANDFGCSVWAIILNISLALGQQADAVDKPLFGFGSETVDPNTYVNYVNEGTDPDLGGNFTNGNGFFDFTLEEKRFILQLRAFQLFSRGTLPDANAFFATIFNAAGYVGEMYLIDNLDMTMNLSFTDAQGSRLRFILENYDIIPRPAGVKLLFPWS